MFEVGRSADGWKLIWNVVVRDNWAELELFDHVNDPRDFAVLKTVVPISRHDVSAESTI